MGKSIGIMSCWAREEFVEPAIKQAAALLVDELYVTVSCMHPDLRIFSDGSEDRVRQLAQQHPNVHYVDALVDYRRPWYENMGLVLNQLLDASKPENGDFILLADVDEFYTKPAMDEINSYIKAHPDFISLRFASKFVGPTWDYFVGHAHTRLHRWWPNRCFVPTSAMEPHINEPPLLLSDNPMYHYSLFVPVDYKDAFWAVEFGLPTPGSQEMKRLWWKQIYQRYDPSKEELWMQRNAEITSHHGFWMEGNCQEREGGGLLTDDAVHPQFIVQSDVRKIIGEDPREYFGRDECRAMGPALETLRGTTGQQRGLWIFDTEWYDAGRLNAVQRDLQLEALTVVDCRSQTAAEALLPAALQQARTVTPVDFAFIDGKAETLLEMCGALYAHLVPGALVAGSVFNKKEDDPVKATQDAMKLLDAAAKCAAAFGQELHVDRMSCWWFYVPAFPTDASYGGVVQTSFVYPLTRAIRAVQQLVPEPSYFEWGWGLSERTALAAGLSDAQCAAIKDAGIVPASNINYRSEHQAGIGYINAPEVRHADIVMVGTPCRRMACYREAVRKSPATTPVLLHGAAQGVSEPFFFSGAKIIDPWTEFNESKQLLEGGVVLYAGDQNVRAFISRFLPIYRSFCPIITGVQHSGPAESVPTPDLKVQPERAVIAAVPVQNVLSQTGQTGQQDVQVNFDDGSVIQRTMIAGPWAGEFGYELMYWVPLLRMMAKKFSKLVAVIPEGHEVLYEDFAAEIITHKIDLGTDKWRANAGDASFWARQWHQFVADGAPREQQENLTWQLAQRRDNAIVLESNKKLFQLPRAFRRLTVPDTERDPQIFAIHCRRAGLDRDWPDEKFDELIQRLNADGITPRIIGLPSDYMPCPSSPGMTRDCRTTDLGQTIRILSEVGLIAGASTGVQHLASLCCAPQVVWGVGSFLIPEYGTVEDAYKHFWNPFDNWCNFLDAGFDPDVELVYNAIIAARKKCPAVAQNAETTAQAAIPGPPSAVPMPDPEPGGLSDAEWEHRVNNVFTGPGWSGTAGIRIL